MSTNRLKILLVFSALLMFAFTGELAAQDLLTLTPPTATVHVEGDTSAVLTALLQDDGEPVSGETIYFYVLNGLGYVNPTSGTTNSYGQTTTRYYAYKTAGTDTVVAYWTDIEEGRAELYDTTIITVGAGNPYSVNLFPEDTTVVVTEDATIVAKIMDAFGNKVNATDPAQVTFTTSGKGTIGTSSINADYNIEMAYHTDDSMVQGPPDVITGRLVVSGLQDQSDVYTIGAAPASIIFTADDSTLVVSEGPDFSSEYYWEELHGALLDEYGNPSAYADWYAVSETDRYYWVHLSVSEGGGGFWLDSVLVDDNGETRTDEAGAWYYSSTVAGVYTITATSGAVTTDLDITQICDLPDSLYITGDSMGIPAGSDTLLTIMMFDQYGNFCPADDERFYESLAWYWETAKDDGIVDEPEIDEESHNWTMRYYSYPLDADTAWIWAGYDEGVEAEVTIFSAEPGEFHHFDLTILNIPPEAVFDDKAYVSDGSDVDTAHLNGVLIEAQDNNNIRLYTYTNPDTVTLTLDGTTAEASQVTWFVADLGGSFQPEGDTVVGLTAPIPPGYFGTPGPFGGLCFALVANQVAETVTITATDTAGHTGTSPELTWLPTEVVGFNVALEGGLTTIHAIDDTVNMEVTAIDEFGNTTGMGLPLNVVLSATRPVNFLGGEMQLMDTPVDLFPMVATQQATDLVLRIADYLEPSINGSSDPITVLASGIDEGPVVSYISAAFGTGDISYAVAKDGDISIKVYNKVGMVVGSLVDGAVSRGYYQASLKGLGLSSDVYFVVMQGPGINKKIKATLIK